MSCCRKRCRDATAQELSTSTQNTADATTAHQHIPISQQANPRSQLQCPTSLILRNEKASAARNYVSLDFNHKKKLNVPSQCSSSFSSAGHVILQIMPDTTNGASLCHHNARLDDVLTAPHRDCTSSFYEIDLSGEMRKSITLNHPADANQGFISRGLDTWVHFAANTSIAAVTDEASPGPSSKIHSPQVSTMYGAGNVDPRPDSASLHACSAQRNPATPSEASFSRGGLLDTAALEAWASPSMLDTRTLFGHPKPIDSRPNNWLQNSTYAPSSPDTLKHSTHLRSAVHGTSNPLDASMIAHPSTPLKPVSKIQLDGALPSQGPNLVQDAQATNKRSWSQAIFVDVFPHLGAAQPNMTAIAPPISSSTQQAKTHTMSNVNQDPRLDDLQGNLQATHAKLCNKRSTRVSVADSAHSHEINTNQALPLQSTSLRSLVQAMHVTHHTSS